jgi:hypothetical protein
LAETDVLKDQVGDDIQLMAGPKQALDEEFEHPMRLNQRRRNFNNAN